MTIIKSPMTNRFRYDWYCASTDTKPTASSANVKPGETLFAYDTGLSYITYDGTNWVELPSGNMSASETLLTSIDTSIDALRGSGSKDLTTLDTLLATALPRNISYWGGIPVTGSDITTYLAALAKIALTIPVLYSVTMTNANTEYSQALSSATKCLMFHCQDGTAFRYAWVTGKVATPTAPYITVPANSAVGLTSLYLTTKTLYVACSSAGKIIEIEEWS